MSKIKLKAGDELLVSGLSGQEAVVERLRELGVTIGEKVRILHLSPFGEPIVVQIRDTAVALRKSELLCIKTT